MDATRILPDLQCSLVCEDIRQEANGKLILIGALDALHVPQLPIFATRLLVFTRWTAGVGQFLQTVRLLAPDSATVLQKNELRFAMQDPYINASNVAVLQQIEMKAAGVYFVEVLVDNVLKIRYPLHVVLVQQPGQPQQPPPQPPTGGTGTSA